MDDESPDMFSGIALEIDAIGKGTS